MSGGLVPTPAGNRPKGIELEVVRGPRRGCTTKGAGVGEGEWDGPGDGEAVGVRDTGEADCDKDVEAVNDALPDPDAVPETEAVADCDSVPACVCVTACVSLCDWLAVLLDDWLCEPLGSTLGVAVGDSVAATLAVSLCDQLGDWVCVGDWVLCLVGVRVTEGVCVRVACDDRVEVLLDVVDSEDEEDADAVTP